MAEPKVTRLGGWQSKFTSIDFANPQTVIWIALGLAALYALVLLVSSPLHTAFNEWGGVMELFSGQEILAGSGYHGWASYFWPPLFSFLIGLGSIVLPGFLAGKLISIAAGSILLFVAYQLALELTQSPAVGLATQVFLALAPNYFAESLDVHNHMLDALLFNIGLWLFLRALRAPRWRGLVLAGIFCGLAGLARFTSYVLFALPLGLFFTDLGFRRAAKLAGLFWAGYVLMSLAWWYPNFVSNGSPFFQRENLNICTAVLPGQSPGTLLSLWQCGSLANLGNAWGIFTAFPAVYLRNFAGNLDASAKMLVTYGGVLTPFVIPAFFAIVFSLKQTRWPLVLAMLGLYILVVSQAFINTWFLLPWTVTVMLITVLFVLDYLGRLEAAYAVLKKFRVRRAALVLLFAAGLIFPLRDLIAFRAESAAGQPLAEAPQVVSALRAHDPNLRQKVVMAMDPAWAYYAGAEYLNTPLVYDGPLDGLVSYRGLSEQVRAYAPKYPSSLPSAGLRADYLVYTKNVDLPGEPRDDPRFAFLLDPASPQIPPNFKVIYHSDNVVVYEIVWSAPP